MRSDDVIRYVRLSSIRLPLAVPISDAKVFTGRQQPMTAVVVLFHHARHWATISVVYHHSDPAHASMELTSTALERIDTLGANAARCYIAAYYP